MKNAEVLIVLGWLPALLVVAAVDLALLWLVLPEIEAFGGEHLGANRKLEIFVRYEAVLVQVEFAEHVVELYL